MRFLGVLGFLIPFLGLALGQMENTPDSIKQVFNNLFGSNAVLEIYEDWGQAFGGLTVPLSNLAKILFVLALIYRMYNLWLSEATSQALLYSLVRWFIVGLFFLLSNPYLYQGNVNYALLGGNGGTFAQRCSAVSDPVLSRVAICTWANSLKSGAESAQRFAGGRLVEQLTEDVLSLTAQVGETLVLLRAVKLLRVGQKYTEAPKTKGSDVQPPSKEETGQAPDAGANVVNNLIKSLGLLPFLLYLVLAVPSTIYFFLALVSGIAVLVAALLLPIAIALVAWGLSRSAISLAFVIFASSLMAYFLPYTFFLSMHVAVHRPAQILESMWGAAMQPLKDGLNNLVKSIDEAEANLQNEMQNADGRKGNWFTEFWNNITRVWDNVKNFGENVLRAITGLALTILLVVLLLTVGTVFMLILIAVSFGAALSLLGVVPNVVLSMAGGQNIPQPNLSGPAPLRANPVYQTFTRR